MQLKKIIENMNSSSQKEELNQIVHTVENLVQIRLEQLTREIEKIDELNFLSEDNPSESYFCEGLISCREFNHLQKCVTMTSKYDFLEEYIDLYLIKHPEVVDYRNELGYTALMIAVSNLDDGSTVKTVEILLKHGANVNLTIDVFVGVFELAIKVKDAEKKDKIIELLLNYGADLKAFDYRPIYFATKYYKCERTIEWILNKLDNCDFMIADKNGHKKFIKFLWENKISNELIIKAIEKGAKIEDLEIDRHIHLLKLNSNLNQ